MKGDGSGGNNLRTAVGTLKENIEETKLKLQGLSSKIFQRERLLKESVAVSLAEKVESHANLMRQVAEAQSTVKTIAKKRDEEMDLHANSINKLASMTIDEKDSEEKIHKETLNRYAKKTALFDKLVENVQVLQHLDDGISTGSKDDIKEDFGNKDQEISKTKDLLSEAQKKHEEVEMTLISRKGMVDKKNFRQMEADFKLEKKQDLELEGKIECINEKIRLRLK